VNERASPGEGLPPRISIPQLAAALVLLATAGLVIAGSRMIPLGTLHAPGPGFIPLLEGGALAAGAVALIVAALRASTEPAAKAAAEEQPKLLHPLLSALLLVLFVAAIPLAGFYSASFCFTALIVLATRRFRWWTAIILSAAITLLLYAVFGLIFDVNLPRGAFL
jgi:hypothetical protein